MSQIWRAGPAEKPGVAADRDGAIFQYRPAAVLAMWVNWSECHNATGADGNLLTGFRIAPWTAILVAQIKIAKPGELDLLARRQCRANFLKE